MWVKTIQFWLWLSQDFTGSFGDRRVLCNKNSTLVFFVLHLKTPGIHCKKKTNCNKLLINWLLQVEESTLMIHFWRCVLCNKYLRLFNGTYRQQLKFLTFSYNLMGDARNRINSFLTKLSWFGRNLSFWFRLNYLDWLFCKTTVWKTRKLGLKVFPQFKTMNSQMPWQKFNSFSSISFL